MTSIGGSAASFIDVRVTGLNMQKVGEAREYLFYTKDVVEIGYDIDVVLGLRGDSDYAKPLRRWTVSKSYADLVALKDHLKLDLTGRTSNEASFLIGSKDALSKMFRVFQGVDGRLTLSGEGEDVDNMLQQKEAVDIFIKALVCNIRVLAYPRLHEFLKVEEHTEDLVGKVKLIQKFARRHFFKTNFWGTLLSHYGAELDSFSEALERGLSVYEVSSSESVYHYDQDSKSYGFACRKKGSYNESPTRQYLWLNVSSVKPSLSRLCIGTKQVLTSVESNQQERLCNGVYLADIADVRLGCSSETFRRSRVEWSDPQASLCIVGTERCLSLQLTEDTMARIPRGLLVDMLRLLSIRALTDEDREARRSVWRRSLNPVPPRPLLSEQLPDAERVTRLFTNSIPIEEELFSQLYGKITEPRTLRYEPQTNVLHVVSPDGLKDRAIHVGDISEIRPGKFSHLMSDEKGGEGQLVLSIVASSCVVCLPVASVAQRNGLIKKFQLFAAHNRRRPAQEYEDSPALFWPERRPHASCAPSSSASPRKVEERRPAAAAKENAQPPVKLLSSSTDSPSKYEFRASTSSDLHFD